MGVGAEGLGYYGGWGREGGGMGGMLKGVELENCLVGIWGE